MKVQLLTTSAVSKMFNPLNRISHSNTNLPNRLLTSWNWYRGDYGDQIFTSKAWIIKIWHNPQAGTNGTLLSFKRFRRTFKCVILATLQNQLTVHLRDTIVWQKANPHPLHENKGNIYKASLKTN